MSSIGRSAAVALALTAAAVGAMCAIRRDGPTPEAELVAPGTAESGAPPPLRPAKGPALKEHPSRDALRSDASIPSGAGGANEAAGAAGAPRVREVAIRTRFFDAESDASMPVRWAPAGSRWTYVDLDALEEGLERGETSFPWGLATDEAATLAVGPDGHVRAEIAFEGPQTHFAWEGRVPEGTLAADVREVVVHVPLRRAMALDVTVLDPTGRPAQGATVAAAWVGGGRVGGGPWPLNADGVARVAAIPFLPGEPLIADVEWTPEPGAQDVVPVPEEGPSAEAPVRTRVPAHPSTPWAVTVRLVGPRAFLSDHNESDNDVAASSAPEPSAPPTAPRGAARVRVVGIDGRPVAGATVTVGSDVGTTAADGTVMVERLLAGDLPVTVRAFGHFPMSGSVRVVADRTTDVELREPVGATLDVLVVDATGAARTAARCVARTGGTIAPFDVTDGVQRLDDFTDARGRRTFARVAPGTVTLTATWGSHRAVVTRDVRDGERAFVRIELP